MAKINYIGPTRIQLDQDNCTRLQGRSVHSYEVFHYGDRIRLVILPVSVTSLKKSKFSQLVDCYLANQRDATRFSSALGVCLL